MDARSTQCHLMPFGASIHGHDAIQFRLWAPAAHHVDLCLEDKATPGIRSVHLKYSMIPEDHGWFQLKTNKARIGSYYRFLIDHQLLVPDPASRFQPYDVHGPSEIINPDEFEWQDQDWHGRPWEETVLYELHTGTFSEHGTYAGIIEKLDYLEDLGITAIELMPIADFPGRWNWGYDGVYLFAPESHYGRPNHLKAFINSAHQHHLMVFLDVVYSHFGPEGNYIHHYAPQFFSTTHQTPWGAAINYDGPNNHTVREFMIHNALYWIEEYHFDGLRLDAVHAIQDHSDPNFLSELAERIHLAQYHRHVHLVLENDRNEVRYLVRNRKTQKPQFNAQWNDDIHHACHVLLTGENDHYYQDYADRPIHHLARCLTEGFAYQGEVSRFRHNASRGESSKNIPLTAFVSFLQNHDQIGNRPYGERLTSLSNHQALKAIIAILLLAPSPPMLFMGEAWGNQQPFLFFCDFSPPLRQKITTARQQLFEKDAQMHTTTPEKRSDFDPMNTESFKKSKLKWSEMSTLPAQDWLDYYRKLIELRRKIILPRLKNLADGSAHFKIEKNSLLTVIWPLHQNASLVVLANLCSQHSLKTITPPGELFFSTDVNPSHTSNPSSLMPSWSVYWYLDEQ